MWNEDEAGPYQTIPYPGSSWQPEGKAVQQPHEYIRNGTAKLLTLLHPATGEVRVKGVTNCPNAVLHPWLKEELTAILKTLPEPSVRLGPEENQAVWESWREGLTIRVTLPCDLPPLRMLLIWDAPFWTQDRSLVALDVQSRHSPAANATGWELVEHGRVHPAHSCTACVRGTTSDQPRANH